MRFLENTGQPTNPQFTNGAFNPLGMVNLTGGNSAPASADIDGDGDRDAFIGDGYGAVHFYEFLSGSGGMDPIVETTPAFGLNQVLQSPPGSEVQILSIGIAGDDVATLSGVQFVLEDVAQSTVALSATDLLAVNLYKSSDSVFDINDVLIGTNAPLIGSVTYIASQVTEVIASTETFYIVTAAIDTGATVGAALSWASRRTVYLPTRTVLERRFCPTTVIALRSPRRERAGRAAPMLWQRRGRPPV